MVTKYPSVFESVLNDHFESRHQDESYSSCNNIEFIRIGTYSTFPFENKPWYLGLARVGFFYTGESDIVECFHCHVKHGNWNAKDDPFEVHRRISPGCEFINSENSLNVPIPRQSEDNRIRKFINNSKHPRRPFHDAIGSVNNPVQRLISSAESVTSVSRVNRNPQLQTSSSLTESALPLVESVSTKSVMKNTQHQKPKLLDMENRSNQETKNTNCYTLQVNAKQFDAVIHHTPSQSPNVHMREFPHSKRPEDDVRPNITKQKSSEIFFQPKPSIEPTAKYLEFSSQNVRASTYHGWPVTSGQLPWRMAEAGFLYAGYSDFVRCFFCGEGLSEWEPSDDPWIEHAKWFPNCLFLRKSKGDNFIFLVRQSMQNQDRTQSQITKGANQKEKLTQPGINPQNLPSVHLVSTDKTSAAVQSVKEMGYSIEGIDTAILSLQREGISINAHNIMKTILSTPTTCQNSDSHQRP